MSSTMGYYNEILRTFLEELPDPGILLYTQRLPEFDKFELFPRLPIELRLLVWKMTLEPRKISISPIYDTGKDWGGKRHVIGLKSGAPAPAVLHITQESRSFGLSHYYTLLQDYRLMNRVVYAEPKLDTVDFNRNGKYDDWSASRHFLSTRLWASMQQIQRLEIHGVWLSSELCEAFRGISNDVEAINKWLLNKLFFTRLTGLRKLYLMQSLEVDLRQGSEGFSTEEGQTDVKESIKAWFARRAIKFPETKTPEIILIL